MVYSWCRKFLFFFLLLPISFSCDAFSSIEGIQNYQKNMHLFAETKMSLANDITRYKNANNIWDVLREEFSLPHYENNPRVQEQIDFFLNHQDFLMRSASRAAPYLYFILQQARKRHLPAEVVLLPIIESAYNPFAYSTAGAAGIWQMMPKTASGYGIKQNWWYDGRRDVVASTKAAQDHLAYLGTFFEGNWLLALAAYDTGEGNVLSAIRKNYQNGLRADYWSLPLAQETREYVPRLLALAIILSHPDEYPIDFPPVQNAPYLAQVDMGSPIDLKYAASLSGLTYKQFMQLNSGHIRPTSDPEGPFNIVLPIENVQQFTENLERSPLYPQIKWPHYKLKNGDTIQTVAKKFNTTPDAIRNNNPKVAALFRPGTNIIIPHPPADISKSLLDTPTHFAVSKNFSDKRTYKKIASRATLSSVLKSTEVSQAKQGVYKLQPGDTLYMVRQTDDILKIATHFKTTPTILMAVNNLQTANISPGDQLIIPTHLITPTAPANVELSPGDTIYMVRRGDTVQKIAEKFKLHASIIRITNLLGNNPIQEGDRLVIPTRG